MIQTKYVKKLTHRHWVILYLQSNGMTPLMYAIKESKTTFLERLVDLGTDVTIRNTVSTVHITLLEYTYKV